MYVSQLVFCICHCKRDPPTIKKQRSRRRRLSARKHRDRERHIKDHRATKHTIHSTGIILYTLLLGVMSCYGNDDGDEEKLVRSADFDGPTRHRHCTDVLCLVLLVVVWAAMTAIGIYAVSEGDYRLVVYPMDYDGNVCGTDFGGVDMTDYPFLHCTLVRNAASMVSAQIICHEPHIPHPFFQIKTSTHSLVACACRIAPWSVKYYGARPTRRPPNYLDLPWT